MKKIIAILLPLSVTIPGHAQCNKNSFSYMNCDAGQLIDICDGVAYWKKQADCCNDASPYIIVYEQISHKNEDFYQPYIHQFDDAVYHCALKIGEINK